MTSDRDLTVDTFYEQRERLKAALMIVAVASITPIAILFGGHGLGWGWTETLSYDAVPTLFTIYILRTLPRWVVTGK